MILGRKEKNLGLLFKKGCDVFILWQRVQSVLESEVLTQVDQKRETNET